MLVDKLLKLLHLRQRETLLNCGCDGTYLCASRNGESHIVGVCRLRNDDFVARVKTRHKCEEHSLRTSSRDDDVVCVHVDVESLVVACKLLAIRQITL